MDVLTAIHSRKSVRQFTPTPITPDQLQILLEAAMMAPSAGNAQPWEFIVISDEELLRKIPQIHPCAKMTDQVSLGILVCGNMQKEKYKGFWVQDCAAATQNLLLAATGLGIGAVWTGIFPIEERVAAFKNLVQLPEHVVPFAFVPVGNTDVSQEKRSRWSQEKIHINNW